MGERPAAIAAAFPSPAGSWRGVFSAKCPDQFCQLSGGSISANAACAASVRTAAVRTTGSTCRQQSIYTAAAASTVCAARLRAAVSSLWPVSSVILSDFICCRHVSAGSCSLWSTHCSWQAIEEQLITSPGDSCVGLELAFTPKLQDEWLPECGGGIVYSHFLSKCTRNRAPSKTN